METLLSVMANYNLLNGLKGFARLQRQILNTGIRSIYVFLDRSERVVQRVRHNVIVSQFIDLLLANQSAGGAESDFCVGVDGTGISYRA